MVLNADWHLTSREAQLAGEMLASGVTILGRANHAQKGLYIQAFFNLSIGFERIAKLIVLGNHRIEKGVWMTNDELKSIGHDTNKLFLACSSIGEQYVHQHSWHIKPKNEICTYIVDCLTEFAKSSRYYNLDNLSAQASVRSTEPVSTWWTKVGLPILDKHYSKKKRTYHENLANAFGVGTKKFVYVLHHDEIGTPIDNIEGMMIQAAQNRIVQKYGQLYTLQLIRWLSTIIYDLSHKGAFENQIEGLLGLYEPFSIFYNDDNYFQTRKTWSIYNR